MQLSLQTKLSGRVLLFVLSNDKICDKLSLENHYPNNKLIPLVE